MEDIKDIRKEFKKELKTTIANYKNVNKDISLKLEDLQKYKKIKYFNRLDTQMRKIEMLSKLKIIDEYQLSRLKATNVRINKIQDEVDTLVGANEVELELSENTVAEGDLE